MKHKIKSMLFCLALTTVCSIDCTAQNYFSFSYYYINSQTGHINVPKVRSIYSSVFNSDTSPLNYNFIGENEMLFSRRGKLKEENTTNYFYTPNGNLTEYAHYENNELEKAWKYEYADNGKLIKARQADGKGKMKYRAEQEFNEQGLITVFRSYDKKNKEIRRIEHDYNAMGKKTEQRAYFKGKMISRSVNEYYESGEIKRSTVYDKKGKINYVWEYTCDPRGDEVRKSDTSKICVSKEALENGGRMEVILTTGEKGETYKRIVYYNDHDQVVKHEHYYPGGDKLSNVATYAYEGKTLIDYEFRAFYKNGNTMSSMVEKRVSDNEYHRERVFNSKRGRERSKFVTDFRLNEDHQLISKVSYNKKGDKVQEFVYTYH